MKNKVILLEEITDFVKDGMTIMVSGFMGCGSAHKILEKLSKSNVKDLILVCNDAGFEEKAVGLMVKKHQFKRIIATHIGLNPEAGRQMNAGETEVELIPQGTMAERIRCAGYGLGGVLTPTGCGTLVEQDKIKMEVEGKTYLLETPLKADVAIIGAKKADKKGNVFYEGTGRNFAPIMAMAADVVIVEVDEMVEVGEIEPENVMTPHILVDYIVDGGR